MKPGCILSLLLLIQLMVQAQQVPLVAKTDGARPYLQHKVAPKENWYSIGRLYNISPKELALFNSTSIDKGLNIGQMLRMPLTQQNFIQVGQAAGDEATVPVYHVAGAGESLSRVAQTYNKLPVDQLKAMNKGSGDKVVEGQRLLVGYLRVKKDLSALATASVLVQQPSVTAAEAKSKAPEKSEPPVPVANTKPSGTESLNVVKTEPKSQKPPTRSTTTEPATRQDKPTISQAQPNLAFQSLFESQSKSSGIKENQGQAAVFKSTSGWKDGRYYALMNQVVPGTVVRILNPTNQKVVYAKVLGEIPAGKENDGLLIRISNAAAAELALPDGRFELQLAWSGN